MSKYKTKPIDFTGCHPVIAEHLKHGEAVLCRVWDGNKTTANILESYIVAYDGSDAPYRTGPDGGCEWWQNAEPIEVKLYWRKASENMMWLEDNFFAYGSVLFHPEEIAALLVCKAGKEKQQSDDFYPAAWFTEK